jgi:hypothetical protein
MYVTLYGRITASAIVFMLVAVISYQNPIQVNAELSRENPNIKQLASYINTNLASDMYYVYEGGVPTSLGLYANRYSLLEALTTVYNTAFVSQLQTDLRNGVTFGAEMSKYKIGMYLTTKSPDAKNNAFAWLYSDDTSNTVAGDLPERTAIILCKENDECTSNTRYLKDSGYDTFAKEIQPYLSFEQQVGPYYVYRIVSSPVATSTDLILHAI